MRVSRCSVILISVINLVVFSCSYSYTDSKHSIKLNEDLITQRFYYETGKLRAERTYKILNGDSIIHGYQKVFYQNGQLQLELMYIDGKKQGFEKVYYENGLLEHVGSYNNDEQDSLWIWYYNSQQASQGPIKAIDFWRNGTPLSHQIKYYENGKEREYLFYDPIGRLVYKRVFDSNGNYEEEGSKLPLIVMVNERNNKFNKGDILKVRIYHVLPPNVVSNIFIRRRRIDNVWEELKSIDKYIPIYYERELNEKGIDTIEVKLKLKDSLVGDITEYINMAEFNVQ